MSSATKKGPAPSAYKDYPFQDKLEDRKNHFKVGRTINRKESGAIKFRVQDILDLIRDKNLKNNPDANLVFHFAAYKKEDWDSYITKPGAVKSGIKKDEFIGRPTVILGYDNSPVSAESFDAGWLCPPPRGC